MWPNTTKGTSGLLKTKLSRRFNKLSNDTKFMNIEVILLKIQVLQSWISFHILYILHTVLLIISEKNLADKMSLLLYWVTNAHTCRRTMRTRRKRRAEAKAYCYLYGPICHKFLLVIFIRMISNYLSASQCNYFKHKTCNFVVLQYLCNCNGSMNILIMSPN